MNRLKELRKDRGLTQSELAEKIGVSKITVLRWEKNERQIKEERADELADFFGVPIAYLLGYSDNIPTDLALRLNKLDSETFKPVKINASNTALSDEELMKLPKEQRQEYLRKQLNNLEVQLNSVSKKLSELSKTSTEQLIQLSSEQLNQLTTSLIQALAKVNEVNKNN